MSNPFVFMDLRSGDPARSRRFSIDLLGWTIIDDPTGATLALWEAKPA